ncbi:hypothetical protein BSLG_005869 [Batrachochytrium salamandrivorans]|nr:hypothetical protein BSLG_005869 [Batrachochytrium salamandrivorans]
MHESLYIQQPLYSIAYNTNCPTNGAFVSIASLILKATQYSPSIPVLKVGPHLELAFDYNTAAPSVDGGTANSTQSGTSKSTAILSSTPDLYKTIVVLHGVGMFVAWGIAPFFGIFIARYLKEN